MRRAVVHLWQIETGQPKADVVEAALALLNGDERVRAARLRRSPDRAAFAAARAGLRLVLSGHTGETPAGISLERAPCSHCGGPHGKPRLRDNPLDLRFSFSSSDGIAVVAVAWRTEVGVDVERRGRPLDAAFAQSAFTARERRLLEVGEADALQLWTRKEACLKGIGAGLSIAPAEIDVGHKRIASAASAALESWSVRDLPLGSDCAAALATSNDSADVQISPVRLVLIDSGLMLMR